MNFIETAELIRLVNSNVKGNKILQKPEKILLNNTNILYALSNKQPEIGTIREIFFSNQIAYLYSLYYPKKGDFIVDETFTFEVGGKNKKSKQIQAIPNAFIAMDEVEIGSQNKIPLWLFGFLY